jgi:two-component system, cell cycle sensor histidine kinase and response regulator CckA
VATWQSEIRQTLGSQIDLCVEATPDLHMSVDPLQISQVLTNLAVNARDAMAGGGRLTVSVAPVQSYSVLDFASVKTPDRYLHVRVADTGSGMTKEQLAHLFEPLFTTKKGGTGLGLAVSYQIVAQHDGVISAESEPGRGTTFHLLLPSALPAVETLEESPAKLPGAARVVIVEDEEAVSAGISALLEMEGIRSFVVDTGRAAVPAIEEFTPDAVILDIGLPDVNGVEVYANIANRWPTLPVLFSSGHAGAAKIETHLTKPNVGLVVKPYDLMTLRNSLAAVMRS